MWASRVVLLASAAAAALALSVQSHPSTAGKPGGASVKVSSGAPTETPTVAGATPTTVEATSVETPKEATQNKTASKKRRFFRLPQRVTASWKTFISQRRRRTGQPKPNQVPPQPAPKQRERQRAPRVSSASVAPAEVPIAYTCEVAIAGGGLSGLALCAALRKAGVDATVFERADALRTSSQGAVILRPHGRAALHAIDPRVPSRLDAVGADFVGFTGVRVAKDGGVAVRTRNATGDGLQLAWADLQDTLATAARGFAGQTENEKGDATWLRCGAAVEAFEERAGHVDVALSSGETVRAAVLVGADGAFSTVRRLVLQSRRRQKKRRLFFGKTNKADHGAAWVGLGPNWRRNNETTSGGHKNNVGMSDDSTKWWSRLVPLRRRLSPPYDAPRYYAQTNWNAIIPRTRLERTAADRGAVVVPKRAARFATYFLSGSPAMVYSLDIGRGRIFWQIRLTDRRISKTVDPTGRGGVGLPGVRDRILDLLEDAILDAPAIEEPLGEVVALVEASEDAEIFERRISDRRPLRSWTSPLRRVVLVGDAAHAMHPLPGQGANTAFEDVEALSRFLAHAKRNDGLLIDVHDRASSGDDDDEPVPPRALSDAIAAYERERLPAANEVLAASRVAGLRQQSGFYNRPTDAQPRDSGTREWSSRIKGPLRIGWIEESRLDRRWQRVARGVRGLRMRLSTMRPPRRRLFFKKWAAGVRLPRLPKIRGAAAPPPPKQNATTQ